MFNSIIKLPNTTLAYHCLRFTFGISFLVHGAIRLPKIQAFATGMAGQFDDTLLAGFPALTFAYAIPFIEALVGLSLLIGGQITRIGLMTGILLMGGIMFGTCMLEKWELLTSQLLHATAFYLLLINPHTAGAEAKSNSNQ
ncbi:DoxX family protein [Rubritalea sp.]|uniref:DoxX family protein n=1 Tax=Rubritalea sp. TaxID=2109375 RepID=UPI003EF1F3C1